MNLCRFLIVSGALALAARGVPLEAFLVGQDGTGTLHVMLTGGDRTTVKYEEVSAPGVKREASMGAMKSLSLVDPPGFSEAMSLFGSRRYRAAREKFAEVQAAYQEFAFLSDNPATLAGFQILECLRQEGDLDGLAKAARGFDKSRLSREYQQRQFDLYAMWDAARSQSWERLEGICRERLEVKLPGTQRAQVAYCLGLALEARGQTDAALSSFHEAMAAAAGFADGTTRQAAQHAMRLYKKKPAVEAELRLRAKGKKDQGPGNSADVRELLALARWYGASFGAGEPLPDDLKDLLPASR